MASPAFPYPILLADIGGTNARFSMVTNEGRTPTPVFRLKTDSTKTFAEACEMAVSMQGLPRPRSLIVDGAGPVIGKRIDLTNADWMIDGDELMASLKLEQGLTINDFEAMALGLPYFTPADLDPIGSAPMADGGTRLVLGPGTGLGVGAGAVPCRRLSADWQRGRPCDLAPARRAGGSHLRGLRAPRRARQRRNVSARRGHSAAA